MVPSQLWAVLFKYFVLDIRKIKFTSTAEKCALNYALAPGTHIQSPRFYCRKQMQQKNINGKYLVIAVGAYLSI